MTVPRSARRLVRVTRSAVMVAFAITAVPVLALVFAAAATSLPNELQSPESFGPSVRYTDREGILLREVRASDAMRARWTPLESVGTNAIEAVVAAEDRRFYLHPGVDPLSIVRALVSSIWHRRVTSGASTLTMQLARIVRPHPRNLWGKLREMALALRIEASLSKRAILEQYINRAPFGSDARGLEAASRSAFDKPPRALSLAEAAALAAVPRGPAVYSFRRHPDRVVRRRNRILARMAAFGRLTEEERDRATSEPLTLQLDGGSFGAPHLVSALHRDAFAPRRDGTVTAATGNEVRGDETEEVTTTLVGALQREAESAVAVTLRPLASRDVTEGSVIVLDNASGEILAYVGSASFFDTGHLGQNDGVRALRQPGSTLKPFVYGLAMERLGYTAATMLSDVETHIEVPSGVYAPMNYDQFFHGPVRLRESLANSLNVPAVRMAETLGPAAVLDRLHELGFASLTQESDHYGPALALGDGEVSLLELANAYATLARGGIFKQVTAVRATRKSGEDNVERQLARPSRRVMPEPVARMLEDILKDRHARASAFGESSALDLSFPVAAKTGTSKGYRDNWTIGFTREVTVAAWVGNFDGTAMNGVSGITGAAPVFRAVMQAAMRGRAPAPMGISAYDNGPRAVRAAPGDADEALSSPFVRRMVCPLSGGAPTAACPHATEEWLPRERAELAPCALHREVLVDVRTGLLADASCKPNVVAPRTYEHYDGQLSDWASRSRRELAPTRVSPLCRATSADPDTRVVRAAGDRAENRVAAASTTTARAVRIGYPNDESRYLVDPSLPRARQTLAIRVDVSWAAPSVRVRVDGLVVGNPSAPYVTHWALAPGDHVIEVDAPGGPTSEPVRIRVD